MRSLPGHSPDVLACRFNAAQTILSDRPEIVTNPVTGSRLAESMNQKLI
jgi:hypothetical protein